MADEPERHGLPEDENVLREDLLREYYEILKVVSEYDARLITVKEWSVTVSLAGLAVGFVEQTSALFGLVAVTAATFWLIEALTKSFQVRYYARMRDIEHAMHHLNSALLGAIGRTSSPRIDMSWSFRGWPEKVHWYTRRKKRERLHEHDDWRADMPLRRSPHEINGLMSRCYYMGHVLLPHAVAFVVGLVLFFCTAAGADWLPPLMPGD